MDYAFLAILIFILWLLATKTKKLRKRLDPEEQLNKREMIVIKHDVNGLNTTHLMQADAPAAEPAQPAPAEVPEPAFELEQEIAVAEAPAA